MHNPRIYPITHELENELQDFMHLPAIQWIVETVGEYEHGTADVIDAFKGCKIEEIAAEALNEGADDVVVTQDLLKTYAAVALDLALVIAKSDPKAIK